MFIYKIPTLAKTVFPKLIWDIPASSAGNKIYFTFDDGPTPEITNFVLEELKKFEAKATFFCIGKNLIEHKTIAQEIISSGSTIGNHTMNHFNAWQVAKKVYHLNALDCELAIEELGVKSIGFRPPYGRITADVYHSVDFGKMYMWSILTGDYRPENKANEIIKACLPLLKPGQIIIFHDSVKAFHNLKIILPAFLDYCKEHNLVPSAL